MPVLTPDQYILAFLLQSLIVAFFCFSLYRALMQVRDSNRTIQAGLVWLLLIPGFSMFWNFRVVASMASSLHREFTDRDFEIEEKPGFTYGMAYAVLTVLPSILVIIMPSLILVAGFLNLIGLVFFVLYWIKINWFKKVLENDAADATGDTSL